MIYNFYYQLEQNSEKVTVAKKKCIKPKLTSTYKQLETYFNEGVIHCYGFNQQ